MSFLAFNLPVFHLPGVIHLAVIVLLAVAIEIKTKRIPNGLTVAGIVLGLLLISWDGNAKLHLLGLILACTCGGPLYVQGWIPGGSLKLLAAVGAIGGPLPVLGSVAMVGLALAVAAFVVRYTEAESSQVPSSPLIAAACFASCWVQYLLTGASA